MFSNLTDIGPSKGVEKINVWLNVLIFFNQTEFSLDSHFNDLFIECLNITCIVCIVPINQDENVWDPQVGKEKISKLTWRHMLALFLQSAVFYLGSWTDHVKE